MSVPFFLKLPRQREGRVSRRPTETVDILPTVVDALELEMREKVEGRSALTDTSPPRKEIEIFFNGAASKFRATTDSLSAGTLASARRKIGLFGPGLPWHQETGFHIGGSKVGSFPVVHERSIHIWIHMPENYGDVDPSGSIVPSLISGDAAAAEGSDIVGRTVAVAVNGTIRTTTRLVARSRRRNRAFWSVVVPPEAFERGANEIRLFEVLTGKRGEVLLGETVRMTH
jgi:hypothetical protein